MPKAGSAKKPSTPDRQPSSGKLGGNKPTRKRSTAPEVPLPMPAKAPKKELAHEIALSQIRNLILEGTYRQGDQLTEEGLLDNLEKYSVGKVSIRRALIELAHEGLVDIRPQSGTFVQTIEEDELYQLWRTRVILEDFFVSTIARDSRTTTNQFLSRARAINKELLELTTRPSDPLSIRQKLAESERLDIEFHDQLAAAAGYSLLKSELTSVRNRLRLAAGPVEVTMDQLCGIVSDHERILQSLRPRDLSWFGDVAGAKLAINSHLRNAADRQKITSRIRHNAEYGNDPIWDLPKELSPRQIKHNVALIALRILLELLVAAEISNQETSDRLLVPTRICSQMNDIAKENSEKEAMNIDNHTKARFISLDIQFHASLAFLSGLMFAGDAIIHVWQRIYDDANRRLDGRQMNNVVQEHNKILRALTYYSGNTDEPNGTKTILEHVKSHLVRAYGRAMQLDAAETSPALENVVGSSATESLPPEVLTFLDWFITQLTAK